jgi:uncharacterized protein YaiI (UPF0178 family)
MQKIKRIFIDSDSCPVKEEIVEVGNEYGEELYFVASYPHKPYFKEGNMIDRFLQNCEEEEL